MVVFKVRTFHKRVKLHETFWFMCIPTTSDIVRELLKIKQTPMKEEIGYVEFLLENVRKYRMPERMGNIVPGGSTVKQWYSSDGEHLGYLDIESIRINENHNVPIDNAQDDLL